MGGWWSGTTPPLFLFFIVMYNKCMQLLKHGIGYSFPFLVTFVFYAYYSEWVFSAREMLKLTGLVAIILFSMTFAVGPLSKFMEWANAWKVFRKYWGECAVIVSAVHIVLAIAVRYKWDIGLMISTRNPYWIGFYFGLAAFLYFLFMTVISNQYSMQKLDHRWKQLQSLGYVAFVFTITHFFLLEMKNGIFIIRRPLGRVAFAIAVAVVVLRLYVWIWAKLTESKTIPTVPVDSNAINDPSNKSAT